MGQKDSKLHEMERRIEGMMDTDKVLISCSGDSALNGQILPAGHSVFWVPAKRGTEPRRLVVKTPPFDEAVVSVSEFQPFHIDRGVSYLESMANRVTVKAAGCWVDGTFYKPGAVVETNWLDHPLLREMTEEEEYADLSISAKAYEAVMGSGVRQAKRKKKSDPEL